MPRPGRYPAERYPAEHRRTSRGRAAALAARGWFLPGLLLGVLIANIGLLVNGTMTRPSDGVLFVGEIGAAYALVFGLLGAGVGFLSRARVGLGGHLALAVLALVVYAVSQQVVGATSPWRQETLPYGLPLGLALAVSAAAFGARRLGGSAPRPFSRPAFAGLALLGAGLLVLPALRPGPPGSHVSARGAEPGLVRRETTGPVILIGIDGADLRSLLPLMEAGALPNWSRLRDEGAWSPLATIAPTWSPVIWSTIGTGLGAEQHGIRDFTEWRLPGMRLGVQRVLPRGGATPDLPVGLGLAPIVRGLQWAGISSQRPVTSWHRKASSLWNMLSEVEVPVGVVNWYATWPAEEVNGFLLADNDPAHYTRFADRIDSASPTSAGMASPPEFLTEVARYVAHDWPEDERERIATILDLQLFAGVRDEAQAALGTHDQALTEMGDVYRGDRLAADVGLHLLREAGTEFLAVYLPGLDRISHRIWGRPELVDPVIANYYAHLDGILGDFLDEAGESATLVVVSDHGWSYERSDRRGHRIPYDGVFFARGPAVAAGRELGSSPTIFDIAPTVLTLLGLPAGEAMEGRVLEEAFAVVPRARTWDYGPYRPRRSVKVGDSTRRDVEGMQNLEQLGYLGE